MPYVVSKYFLPFHWFFSSLFFFFLRNAETLRFNAVFYIMPMLPVFWGLYPKNHCQHECQEGFLLCSFSRYVWEEGSSVCFACASADLKTCVGRLAFPIVCAWAFEDQLTVNASAHFCVFYFVPSVLNAFLCWGLLFCILSLCYLFKPEFDVSTFAVTLLKLFFCHCYSCLPPQDLWWLCVDFRLVFFYLEKKLLLEFS